MLDLLSYLSKLGNVDDDLSNLNEMTDSIVTKRKNLRKVLSQREIENSSKYFDTIAKQIQKKLDNLIDRKKVEQKRVAGELKFVNNKKKLSNYNR